MSAEFGLPLSVLALRPRSSQATFGPEDIRLALEALRVADLICQPRPAELLVALPNTKTDDARVVEERLRSAIPAAVFGVVHRARDDRPETLLERARAAALSDGPS